MEYESKVKEAYRNKLKNRLYGLLCEREKEGEWEKFLDSLLIEFYQFNEEDKTINYYRLIEKLSKMKYLRFSYFRPLIFECMNLIDKIGD
jgi:hypothetical protein